MYKFVADFVLGNFEASLHRIAKGRSRFAQAYFKAKDEALGREMVGVDKFGNKYYQYYSHQGLPTKRMVAYQFYGCNQFHIDPHFVSWLHKQEAVPPTVEALERMYIEHD